MAIGLQKHCTFDHYCPFFQKASIILNMKVVPNDNLNLAVKELGHVVVCAIWRDRKPRLYWQKYLQNAILPTVQPLLLLFSTQIFQLLNHVSYI